MSDTKPAPIKREYIFWIGLFGALLSAGPLISLAQKVFSVGLVPILADALTFYRSIMHPIADLLYRVAAYIPLFDFYNWVFSWFMSFETYKDLLVLSAVSTTALARTHALTVPMDDIKTPGVWITVVLFSILLALFVTVTLVTLILPLAAFVAYFDRDNSRSDIEQRRLYQRTYLLSLLTAIAAAVIFFITNALLK